MSERESFGLMRIELDRCGLADHDFLALLFSEHLIDSQNPDVSQDRFGDVFFDAGKLFRRLVAARQQNVDMVIREDEAAGAGIGCHIHRNRAHAVGQHRGQKAAGL